MTERDSGMRDVKRQVVLSVAARTEACVVCGKTATGINVILGPVCSKSCLLGYWDGTAGNGT